MYVNPSRNPKAIHRMNEPTLVQDPAAPSPGELAGISEEMICNLVHTFYGHIRADATLGPIFQDVIGENWDPHLAKMCDFWSSVTLKSARYKGTPMAAHIRIDRLEDRHFDHWLALFRETVAEICPADAAALFDDRARRIAQSLRLGVAMHRGKLTVTPPGQP